MELKSTHAADRANRRGRGTDEIRKQTTCRTCGCPAREDNRWRSRLPFGSEVLDASGDSVGAVAQSGRIIVHGLKSDGECLIRVVLDAARAEALQVSYTLPKRNGASRAAFLA